MSATRFGPNQRRRGVRRITISVDLLPDQHERLRLVAKGKGVSMSRHLVELFEEENRHGHRIKK